MYDGGSNQTDFIVQIYDEDTLCREIKTPNTFLNIDSKIFYSKFKKNINPFLNLF